MKYTILLKRTYIFLLFSIVSLISCEKDDHVRLEVSESIIIVRDTISIDSTEYDTIPINLTDTIYDIDCSLPNLLACYPFNGNANDESGNGIHGTVEGASLTEDRFGNPNSAYEFGIDSFIDIPNAQRLQTGFPFVISMWFNSNSFIDPIFNDQSTVLFTQVQNENLYEGIIINTFENRITISKRDGNGNAKPNYAITRVIPFDLETKTWYHLYISYINDDSLKTFIDGIEYTHQFIKGTGSDMKITSTDKPASFGSSRSILFDPTTGQGTNILKQRAFYGMIDDVKFFSESLTQEQVNELYNEGL